MMEHNMLYVLTFHAAPMEIEKKPPLLLPTPDLRTPLVSERIDLLEGDEPAAAKVSAFLRGALAANGNHGTTDALVPWMCDVLLSKHSLKAYGRDLVDFVRRM